MTTTQITGQATRQLATTTVQGTTYGVRLTEVDGQTWTTATSPTGASKMFRVGKVERTNPAARGGATRTEWEARTPGRNVYADTRKAAIAAAVESLRDRFPSFR